MEEKYKQVYSPRHNKEVPLNLMSKQLGTKLRSFIAYEKLSALYKDVINALRKPKEERQHWDEQFIIDFLKHEVDFFVNLNLKDVELKEMTTAMQLKSAQKGDYLINFHEVGNTWYIVMSGKISIWVPTALGQMKLVLDQLCDQLDQPYDQSTFSKSNLSDKQNIFRNALMRKIVYVRPSDFNFQFYMPEPKIKHQKKMHQHQVNNLENEDAKSPKSPNSPNSPKSNAKSNPDLSGDQFQQFSNEFNNHVGELATFKAFRQRFPCIRFREQKRRQTIAGTNILPKKGYQEASDLLHGLQINNMKFSNQRKTQKPQDYQFLAVSPSHFKSKQKSKDTDFVNQASTQKHHKKRKKIKVKEQKKIFMKVQNAVIQRIRKNFIADLTDAQLRESTDQILSLQKLKSQFLQRIDTLVKRKSQFTKKKKMQKAQNSIQTFEMIERDGTSVSPGKKPVEKKASGSVDQPAESHKIDLKIFNAKRDSEVSAKTKSYISTQKSIDHSPSNRHDSIVNSIDEGGQINSPPRRMQSRCNSPFKQMQKEPESSGDDSDETNHSFDSNEDKNIQNYTVSEMANSMFEDGQIPEHTFSFLDNDYEYRRGFYFKFFDHKSKGYSFGEVALTEADQLRTCTIKCEEDCFFAALGRKPYQRQICRIQQKRQNVIIDFLHSIPVFRHQPSMQLKRFQYSLDKVKFSRKQVVYKEQDDFDFVYIVLKGEFMLTKKLPKSNNSAQTQQFTELMGLNKRNQQGELLAPGNVLSSKLTEIKDFPNQQKLKVYGRGSLIGEEDMHLGHYTCSLTCISVKGTMYKVRKVHILDLMRNQQTKDAVTQRVKSKQDYKDCKHIKTHKQIKQDDLCLQSDIDSDNSLEKKPDAKDKHQEKNVSPDATKSLFSQNNIQKQHFQHNIQPQSPVDCIQNELCNYEFTSKVQKVNKNSTQPQLNSAQSQQKLAQDNSKRRLSPQSSKTQAFSPVSASQKNKQQTQTCLSSQNSGAKKMFQNEDIQFDFHVGEQQVGEFEEQQKSQMNSHRNRQDSPHNKVMRYNPTPLISRDPKQNNLQLSRNEAQRRTKSALNQKIIKNKSCLRSSQNSRYLQTNELTSSNQANHVLLSRHSRVSNLISPSSEQKSFVKDISKDINNYHFAQKQSSHLQVPSQQSQISIFRAQQPISPLNQNTFTQIFPISDAQPYKEEIQDKSKQTKSKNQADKVKQSKKQQEEIQLQKLDDKKKESNPKMLTNYSKSCHQFKQMFPVPEQGAFHLGHRIVNYQNQAYFQEKNLEKDLQAAVSQLKSVKNSQIANQLLSPQNQQNQPVRDNKIRVAPRVRSPNNKYEGEVVQPPKQIDPKKTKMLSNILARIKDSSDPQASQDKAQTCSQANQGYRNRGVPSFLTQSTELAPWTKKSLIQIYKQKEKELKNSN